MARVGGLLWSLGSSGIASQEPPCMHFQLSFFVVLIVNRQ